MHGDRLPSVQTGVALVMVLWVISLMSIMAGSFALSTQREASIMSHAHERAKAVALAEGGVNYAMIMLSLPDTQLRWQADGTPYVWQLDGARVHIRILDESGKVDINAVQEPTLKAILKLALGNEDQAAQLTDAILDWRDADDLKHTQGAEAEDYKARQMKTLPQNRNFLIMEELQSVMGMTPALYRTLLPWFTLYTGTDGLNPAKASREILLKLMNGDLAAVDQYIQPRRQGSTGVPPALPSLPGMPAGGGGGSGDMAYTIEALAEIEGQRRQGVVTTVRRGGAQGIPFTTLRWKPYTPPPEPEPQPDRHG